MPEPIRRSSRLTSISKPLDLRFFTGAGLLGILSKIDSKKEVLQLLLAFRLTCKTFKGAVENNENFGNLFFSILGVDVSKEVWKEGLKEISWFSLFRKYYYEPQTIVVLDYSFSMDRSIVPLEIDRMDVALSIFESIFKNRSSKLRSEITVYVLGANWRKEVIKTQEELEFIKDKIKRRTYYAVERLATSIDSLMKDLVESPTSPLVQGSYGRSGEINLISDNHIDFSIFRTAIGYLQTFAKKRSNKRQSCVFHFRNTIKSPLNQVVFDRAVQQIEQTKTKRQIILIQDHRHEAKRQKIDYSNIVDFNDIEVNMPIIHDDLGEVFFGESSIDSLATPPNLGPEDDIELPPDSMDDGLFGDEDPN